MCAARCLETAKVVPKGHAGPSFFSPVPEYGTGPVLTFISDGQDVKDTDRPPGSASVNIR